MTDADDRSALKPHVNRRIEVEGTVSQIGSYHDDKCRREVPSLCLRNVEVREGDHPVVDHCWLTFAQIVLKEGVAVGDTIRVTAQAYSYSKRDPDDPNKVVRRYGLREPRDLKCLNRDLRAEEKELTRTADANGRLAIAEGRMTKEDEQIEELEVPPLPPEPTSAPPADPKRALLDALWRLVDAHGIERVKKTLQAVETLQGD